ncbi:hypothetical protein MGN70_007610 [Eutypa lata]|nr:hypothetical protein MGN70_007610 [Eutypa lata]
MSVHPAAPWAQLPRIQEPHPEELQDVCLNDDANGARVLLPRGTRPDCLRSATRECLFVALIAFAAATPVFLQRSTVVITESIAEALVITPAELAWVTAGSGFTTGSFLLPFGHIADTCPTLPRKTLLVASLIAFSLLVALTSFSRSGVVLDFVSSLAGIASAANIPFAVGILSLTYPNPSRRKNIVFSSFLMGTPAATIIGGLCSGGLAQRVSWRAPFVCLSVLYAIVSILAWAYVPDISEPEERYDKAEVQPLTERDTYPLVQDQTQKRFALRRFDWLGLFLLVSGVLLFTIALTIGPQGPEPWKTPTVILLLTLGILFLGCFTLWENVTKTPMIPPSI